MDNGYIICGFAFSNDGDVTGNNGFWDIWIVKTDSTGVLEWQQCIGGGDYDLGMDIKQTVDGGYIVAGVSNPDNQFMTYKLNSNGIIQWSNDYGGTNIDKPYAIWATSDGGSILAGNTYSNDGDVSGNHSDSSDFWILKLDISGTVLWQKCLGGIEDDRAYSVQQTSDDGYVVTGRTFSNDGDVSINHGEYDYWVVKLAPDHCSASFDLYPDTIPLHYIAVNLATGVAPVSYEWNWGDGTQDFTAYPSHTYSIPGTYTICLTITDAIACSDTFCSDYTFKTETPIAYINVVSPTGIDDLIPEQQFTLYPNPATTTLTIESMVNSQWSVVNIYNTQGQEVKQLSPDSYRDVNYPLSIDISQFPSGLYYLTLQNNEGVATKKFEVIR